LKKEGCGIHGIAINHLKGSVMWHDPITRYTLGVSAMFSFYWLCKRFVVSPLLAKRRLPKESEQMLSTALLYLPGLGLLLLFINDLPVFQVSPQGFVTADYAVVFAAQFFAFMLMALFTALEIKLGLVMPQALQKQKEGKNALNVLLLLMLVPLMEELLSRKLLGDLLGTGQVRLFLCTSALVFSLLHLQTGRLAVAVGMLYAGFLWAWVYASSGSLLLSTVYHALFNLLMVFIPEHLERKKSDKAHRMYIAGLMLVGTIGFILLASNLAHYLPSGMPDAQSPWQRILGNGGFWVLAAVCALRYFCGLKMLKAKGTLSEKI
jgi:membrane protease YdiL (CAAX protease family)